MYFKIKTRRRSVDARSLLSDNKSLDTFPSTTFIDPSATITTTAQVSTVTVTATTATAATTTPVSATLDQSTTLTLKSDVWQYFERTTFVPPLKARCKICLEKLATPNYATTSLRQHLARQHNLQQFTSNATSRPHSTYIHLSKAEKQKLDAMAIDAIIKDSRSFGDFHKSGLKTFIDALKPGK